MDATFASTRKIFGLHPVPKNFNQGGQMKNPDERGFWWIIRLDDWRYKTMMLVDPVRETGIFKKFWRKFVGVARNKSG